MMVVSHVVFWRSSWDASASAANRSAPEGATWSAIHT